MRGFIAAVTLSAFAALGLSGCGSEEKENLARRIIYHPGNGKDIKVEWTINKLPNGDTLLHGPMKEYHRGGSNKKSVEWKHGRKDGTAQAWYENGRQQWLKSYKEGRKVSTWRLFFSDGNPWMVLHYNKEGALEGTVQRWDRQDPAQPKEAVYANGNCTSGDCNLLELPEAAEDLPPANKVQIARDREILADFLD